MIVLHGTEHPLGILKFDDITSAEIFASEVVKRKPVTRLGERMQVIRLPHRHDVDPAQCC